MWMIAITMITRNTLFSGLINGLVFGLLAMGIVLIYRSTKVINFAVGNMGLPGTALFAVMMINYDFPFWPALFAALAIGAVIGTTVELIVVRRLFDRPRVILLVATVGLAQLMSAVLLTIPDPDVGDAVIGYPVAIGSMWEDVFGLRIRGADIQILVLVPVIALLLGLWLNRTVFGKSITASADNPDLSRLAGINPKIVSTVVWTIGGFLSTLSMILLSGGGGAAGLTNLGPFTLTSALAAAVLGGMRSFPRAMVGGIVVGLAENAFRFYFPGDPGLSSFIFFIAIVVAIYWQSRGADDSVMSFAPKVQPIPDRLKDVFWIKHLPRIAISFVLLLVFLLTWFHESIGFFEIKSSRFLLYSAIAAFAICAASVTVITGWSGQLSLAQMAYAGLGALSAATFHRGLSMDIGWRGTRIIDFELGGVPQLWAIILATFTTAAIAAITGIGALRVRGLMLAISTFAFAIAAQQYLYARPLFSGGERSVLFDRGYFLTVFLKDQRNYFYFTLCCTVLVMLVLSRLRRSGIGRSIIAARDNPDTAAAYTVSPVRMKLMAFAIAGGTAGFGGALLGNLVRNIRYSEANFLVGDSLQLVGMTVIGGLGSVLGSVLGALWVRGLPTFWPDNELVPLFSSSIGLLVILMYFPGGMIQIANAARQGIVGLAERRLPPEPPAASATAPPPSLAASGRHHEIPAIALRTESVGVRFGGNIAVNEVTLEVRRDEIVGLIGTNGAGKSTLMNAVGGFVPSTGKVEVMGNAVTGLSAPARARCGLGRTFQAATLFPELTVRETVQVALEARGRTSFIKTALFLNGPSERRQRAEADDLIGFLGLGRYADAYVSDLSTGTRRIVELAGLLAVDARMLCLDEPTAGVAQRETEAFGPLIQEIRRELGASMLIIEHDMPLIMSISDRVYCLESGAIIAEGDPTTVRNDPAVVASYLGTDDRAIERSDSGS